MSLGKLLGIDQDKAVDKAVDGISDEVEELLGNMTLAQWFEKYSNNHQVGFKVSIVDNAVTGAAWLEEKKEKPS